MTDTYQHNLPDGGRLVVHRLSLRTSDERAQYRYQIYDQAGTLLGDGSDLASGVGGNPSARDMLPSLLSFLGAFAESRRYGNPDSDNWDLFPDAMAEWAIANEDELILLQEELEPGG